MATSLLLAGNMLYAADGEIKRDLNEIKQDRKELRHDVNQHIGKR